MKRPIYVNALKAMINKFGENGKWFRISLRYANRKVYGTKKKTERRISHSYPEKNNQLNKLSEQASVRKLIKHIFSRRFETK